MYRFFFILILIVFYVNGPAQKSGNSSGTSQSSDTSFWDKGSIFSIEDDAQEYVSQACMQTILDAVNNKTLKDYLPVGAAEQPNRLYATSLPKTGKAGNFAVHYQTDGKGSYFTLVTLSNNTGDYMDAAKFVIGLADKMAKHPCLYRRPKDALRSGSGDTTVIRFGEDIMYGSKDYLEWMVHRMAASANESYVVLLIKTIPYAALEEQQKNVVKSNGIDDKVFCDDVMAIVNESRNGFANVRGTGQKDKYTDAIIYPTSLNHRSFSNAQIKAISELDVLDGGGRYTIFEYEAGANLSLPENDAVKEFNIMVKKLDACIDFGTRTPEKLNQFGVKGLSVNYTIRNTNVKLGLTLMQMGENEWSLGLIVVDKSARAK